MYKRQVLSPINSYAAELPKERKLPLLEEVQSQLDEDEIVLAKDHQVEEMCIRDSPLTVRRETPTASANWVWLSSLFFLKFFTFSPNVIKIPTF